MIGTLTTGLAGIPDGAVTRIVGVGVGHCWVSWAGGRPRLAQWSQVTDVRPDPDWTARAKCSLADAGLFEGVGYVSAEVSEVAAGLCAGCPVLRDCVVDAVRGRSVPIGVVRGGVALPGLPVGSAHVESAGVLNRLAERLGLPVRVEAPVPPPPVRRLAPRHRVFLSVVESLVADGRRFTVEDLVALVPGGSRRSAQESVRQFVLQGRLQCVEPCVGGVSPAVYAGADPEEVL